jgi:hypothetical protein
MPPVSEAQRRAMRAAAAGHSTLGIPQKVGAEFSSADKGGKLPAKKKKHNNPGTDYGRMVATAKNYAK